jgi:hypothetical protein
LPFTARQTLPSDGRLFLVNIRIEFKPEDLWIGVFWRKQHEQGWHTRFDVWICILPCVPIHVWWQRVNVPWKEPSDDAH